MTRFDLTAAELVALAGRLRRLRPLNSDPEAFHVERSKIAGEIDRLATSLDAEAARRAVHQRRLDDGQGRRRRTLGAIDVNGRRVMVQEVRPAFRICA